MNTTTNLASITAQIAALKAQAAEVAKESKEDARAVKAMDRELERVLIKQAKDTKNAMIDEILAMMKPFGITTANLV